MCTRLSIQEYKPLWAVGAVGERMDRRSFLKNAGQATLVIPAIALGQTSPEESAPSEQETLEPLPLVEAQTVLTASYINDLVSRVNKLSET
jgi:hypothetical protein